MLILNEELDRLRTFLNLRWPSAAPVRPSVLAECGFYYTGRDDTVKCYSCSVALRDWRFDDHPLVRHRRTNLDCPVITDRDNLNAVIHYSSDVQLNDLAQRPISSLEQDEYIIPSVNRSCPNEHSLLHLRRNSFRKLTFRDWLKEDIVSATSLARAGFFYTGYDDRVRCAFCRRDFVNWQTGDVPTEEHRREVPNCAFVMHNFCFPEQLSAPSVSELQEQVRDNTVGYVFLQLFTLWTSLRCGRICEV